MAPSRKILDTRCPVVPEEVMVLNTSPSGMLRSSSSLNRDTGSMGVFSTVQSMWAGQPRASSRRPYSGQRSR
ncbi:Uncharacterised protein [Flavonifractor plautii]|uniref:Uncharacterized protein n=1 Tax=Flavonifractor plautii TaxID=292800 RepID=A0A174L607_FLAPL|nr:Uncharacterised protein [Flavonifractor plautii]